jgi:hypothetical protein
MARDETLLRNIFWWIYEEMIPIAVDARPRHKERCDKIMGHQFRRLPASG